MKILITNPVLIAGKTANPGELVEVDNFLAQQIVACNRAKIATADEELKPPMVAPEVEPIPVEVETRESGLPTRKRR